ncbi:hypothetical protein C2S51_036122 [Perilla frutescens var. frutescens]|nr:hypothetical protein C2S51_036122 [Perilla frutescens var. frutescens]
MLRTPNMEDRMSQIRKLTCLVNLLKLRGCIKSIVAAALVVYASSSLFKNANSHFILGKFYINEKIYHHCSDDRWLTGYPHID